MANEAEELRVLNVYPETISDGWGIRYAVYFAGCPHRCAQCHNPQSWSLKSGKPLDGDFCDELFRDMLSNPLLDGITLSGGDPLFLAVPALNFLKELKARTKLNVWCYTGWTYEELSQDSARMECLKYIDVLVDGRFVKKLADPRLSFRGSSNQRIILLKNGEAVSLSNDGSSFDEAF